MILHHYLPNDHIVLSFAEMPRSMVPYDARHHGLARSNFPLDWEVVFVYGLTLVYDESNLLCFALQASGSTFQKHFRSLG